MAKGKKTGGRKKGTPNKITLEVRESLVAAFMRAEMIGFVQTLAQEKPKVLEAILKNVVPAAVLKALLAGLPSEAHSHSTFLPDLPEEKKWLSRAELARYLTQNGYPITMESLAQGRGKFPPFFKAAGRVSYAREDVNAWLGKLRDRQIRKL